MKTFAHTLHFMGISGYFVTAVLQSGLALKLPDHPELVPFAAGLFYMGAIPAFMVAFISGIVLTVWENYVFNREKWLKRKAVFSLMLMALIILAEMPLIRSMSTAHVTGVEQTPYRWLMILSGVQSVVVLYLVVVSFHARKLHSR